jgi:hypothetical protein
VVIVPKIASERNANHQDFPANAKNFENSGA